MTWSEDDVEEIIEHLGEVCTLWLLALIEKNIGKNKAHNYTVFPGKIKSLAKEYEMEPPNRGEISDAFQDLNRIPISTPDGREDTVILGDKQEYVKVTDHGLTLITIIDNSGEIESFIDQFLGEEQQEQEEWFPADAPDEAPIKLTALSEEPTDEAFFEVDALAEFNCPYPDCDEVIENGYSFVHPEETWTKKVQEECSGCGETWEHTAGHAWEEPTTPT